MRGIHRSPVNSSHKGQWRAALILSLICVWINGWVNNREAGDLRRYRANYEVSVIDYIQQIYRVAKPTFSVGKDIELHLSKIRDFMTVRLNHLWGERVWVRRDYIPQNMLDVISDPCPTLSYTTVYPKKNAHGFVVLCFVVVMQSFIMNSHEVFIHINQGCFAGTGAIVRLPQCQWSKPDGYGKISQCVTTTKHSKAKTVCIFLGIYCMSVKGMKVVCYLASSETLLTVEVVLSYTLVPSLSLYFIQRLRECSRNSISVPMCEQNIEFGCKACMMFCKYGFAMG